MNRRPCKVTGWRVETVYQADDGTDRRVVSEPMHETRARALWRTADRAGLTAFLLNPLGVTVAGRRFGSGGGVTGEAA